MPEKNPPVEGPSVAQAPEQGCRTLHVGEEEGKRRHPKSVKDRSP